MKKIEALIDKSEEMRELDRAIASKVKELSQLYEQAKSVRTQMEGLAWDVVDSTRKADSDSNAVDLSVAKYVLRSLGLKAAASVIHNSNDPWKKP